ncbi:hypothetical protein NOF04DRAFT_5898 [Fusarium oxysporum II5]|uniref:Deubiquitination-protection protein dph1 n=2 Tax=Fusarium oxysporum species complex TaxID=171631 RepID=A0A559LLS9_FUSOC|nr:uncharacterized protein FOIG_16738 [Fusarium odoratissimum NRRL 54006]EXL89986.1 hypothetical protein FOIG_16738 [Fusarium odoratissimum NRRL 54006]KAK2122203.1 hypothetical protein NOF04DRAFT_5898 [Fusarium oxysporum II5]TVY75231.1 Deubiquitination-protection protein dph1 [Fusarium oxysporum f. sp. cubense]TXB97984.1 hypothetical protein FocTR4_00017147 [Fusarium oxysporum f. sp. cubense]
MSPANEMADNPQSSNDSQISFKVKILSGSSRDFIMDGLETDFDLREKVAAEFPKEISANSSRVIFSGRVMASDKTLSACGIKSGNTVFIHNSAASNQQSDPASGVNTPASTPISAKTDMINQLFANLTDTAPDNICAPDHLQGVDAAFQNPNLIEALLGFELPLKNFQAQPLFQLFPLTTPLPDDDMMIAGESLSSSGCEGIGAFLTPVFIAENVHGQRKQNTSVTRLFPPDLAGIQMREGIPDVRSPMQDLDELHLEVRYEDYYAEQLRQLNNKGFYDFDHNVEALNQVGGSVEGAIEYLRRKKLDNVPDRS